MNGAHDKYKKARKFAKEFSRNLRGRIVNRHEEDEYLLDFINVEELGMRDEEVDERVVEQRIVQNVKNFIMTFGRGFAFRQKRNWRRYLKAEPWAP